ncbi:uL14 family ribosomal protein [Geminisphaera colitermitum]|uniref:uL14 family ribosomal protein n=1 Tax=Geminisphaera colitermitum TaxID=1148786 RepID=UPI0001964FE8|nr:uL14 family ribosomal protein [Geminisphaera colitermitum]
MKTIETKLGASIRYRIEVINPDGMLADSRPWKKNLILDWGLNAIANYRWNEVTRYAVAGTGAKPTRRDSAAVTFTQTAKTVTASAGFFEAEDAGRLLKLNTGEELRIEAVPDAVTATVKTSRESAEPTPGTIWYVNQTGHETEVMRTDTYGNAADDNTVVLINGSVVMKRTYIFAPVTQQRTIREIGWALYSDSALFGRDVLAGAGVTLVTGQQLKVVLELDIAVSPLAPEPAGPFWQAGISGQAQFENLNWGHRFHPSGTYNYYIPVFLSDSLDAFKQPGLEAQAGALTGTTKTVEPVRAAYVSGSFQYTYRASFQLNDGNLPAVRCFGFGWWDYQTFYPIFRIIFDQPQTKDSDHTLTLDFEISWGRVLIN